MGRVVNKDGEIQYLSPTGISKGDPTQDGGCLRKWHYRYVLGLPEPTTKAQGVGIQLHDEIESYLKTGVKDLSSLALSGETFIPEPDPSLLVEHHIEGELFVLPDIPAKGFIDLVNPTGEYISPMGSRREDPAGTWEVNDWKTTGDFKWAKSGFQLVETVQMPMYGKWALDNGATAVRLSHVYFHTRKRVPAEKSTIFVEPEGIQKRWEHIQSVGRSLVDVAKIDDAHKVEANDRACNAFGGCPFRTQCKTGKSNALARLFGEDNAMSILAQLNKSKESEAPPPVNLPDGFKDAVDYLKSREGKYGFPGTGGDAAKLVSLVLTGKATDASGLAGTGELGGLMYTTADEVIKLSEDIKELEAKKGAKDKEPEVALTPPGTPEPAKDEKPAPKKKKAPAKKKAAAPKKETKETTDTADLTVYVNCIPSTPYQSLDEYSAAVCKTICEQFGAVDLRAGDCEELAFGKWKGVLAACVRKEPPESGVYVIDARGNEIAEIVAATLRELATVYVVGI